MQGVKILGKEVLSPLIKISNSKQLPIPIFLVVFFMLLGMGCWVSLLVNDLKKTKPTLQQFHSFFQTLFGLFSYFIYLFIFNTENYIQIA